MKQPHYLKKDDQVALVCTARKFTKEACEPAIQLLASWGLKAVLGATIGKDNFQLGGTDEERAADLQQMLDRPDIKAIWIARGGYGTVRILDKLDFTAFIKAPKWIVGFSDITVLHSHVNTLQIPSIHAIMPFTVPNTIESAVVSLRKALFGETLSYEIPSHPANKTGQASGELVGGNLSILYSLLGSATSLNTKGKILYIEDLDEYLYHIDRMMYNLKRNGYFEGLQGMVVGGMTDMHDNAIPFGFDAVQIILDITKEYAFPVCFDFPAGHVQDNRALRLGQQVVLAVEKERTSLTFSDGGA